MKREKKNNLLKENALRLLTIFMIAIVQVEGHQSHPTDSQIDNIFSYVIIIGGYVFLIIGAFTYKLETQSQKIITFQEVFTKDKSNSGVVTQSGHKFQDFNEEIDLPKKIPQEQGNDSARRKKRKRKADRLSDRRSRQNENNTQEQENQEQQEKE